MAEVNDYDLIMNILRRLTTDKNRTVIVVTHNSYIAEMADKIIVIRDGKLQQREPIDGDA